MRGGSGADIMKAKIMALGLVIIVVVMAAVIIISQRGNNTNVSISGYLGGEKIGFFEDQQVRDIFKKKYGLTVSFTKMGSLDMARSDIGGVDYIFPSNSFAVELFKSSGGHYKKADDVFVSPIVIYSWDKAVDALLAKGVVSKVADTVYALDMAKLVELTLAETTWEDIGLNELYGPICVYSTDPVHSNSGNLLTVLAATVLNGNKVVKKADILGLIEPLTEFLSKSGYKETSSADLFSQYLRTGMGGKTLVALYENQLIEFAGQNPQEWAKIKDKVRILYPTPTVWSNHQFIALNDKAERFFEAMADGEIRNNVWEKHGFRVGSTGVSELSAEMREIGIAEDVTKIIQMPDYSAMEELLNFLAARWNDPIHQ
jgi:hypothetical protein